MTKKEREVKVRSELPWQETGVALHTALRKVCDSHITSLAYNLVCLLGESWRAYARLVAVERLGGKQPVESCKAAMALYLNLEPKPGNRWLDEPNGRAEQMALWCTLRMFDGTDWSCFASYLTEID